MNIIVNLNVDLIVKLIVNLIVNLSVDIQYIYTIYIKGVSTNAVFTYHGVFQEPKCALRGD